MLVADQDRHRRETSWRRPARRAARQQFDRWCDVNWAASCVLLREACGKTREDVAATKLMSRGKLELIEFGRTWSAPGTSTSWGRLYGASPDVVDALRELAVATTQEGWWQEYGGRTWRRLRHLPRPGVRRHRDPGLRAAGDPRSVPDRGLRPGGRAGQRSRAERDRHRGQRAAARGTAAGPALRRTSGSAFRPSSVRPALRLRGGRARDHGRAQYDRLRHWPATATVDLRVLPVPAGAHPGLLGGVHDPGLRRPRGPRRSPTSSRTREPDTVTRRPK